MQPEDMILVSVDDHLVEPPNLFEGRVASKYADETPLIIRQRDGSEVWTFNGAIIPNIGLNAVAGRPREEYGVEPTAFDEMRPGCYDIHERIKDMDAGGVLGSMCFPSFPGFAGRQHRTREQCTVGALRAEVGDHDVAVRSFDRGRFECTAGATLGSESAKLDV
ncbi:hypothetical protein A5686_04235 [Mycobacterium sp. E2479]|nr:hypothetical protein A5686_04235 [Mycobacterium sp. E2479]